MAIQIAIRSLLAAGSLPPTEASNILEMRLGAHPRSIGFGAPLRQQRNHTTGEAVINGTPLSGTALSNLLDGLVLIIFGPTVLYLLASNPLAGTLQLRILISSSPLAGECVRPVCTSPTNCWNKLPRKKMKKRRLRS